MNDALNGTQIEDLKKYRDDRKEWAEYQAQRKAEREAEIREYAARLLRD